MSGSPIALLEGRFFASLLPFIRIISQLPPKTKIFTAAAGAQYNFPRICMAEGKAETAPTIFDRRIQMAPAVRRIRYDLAKEGEINGRGKGPVSRSSGPPF